MFENIIILAGSTLMVVLSLHVIRKQNILKRRGIVAEGIIYDLVYDQSASHNLKYPIIKFLTRNQEGITGIPHFNMTAGWYKKGQEVKIVYDPKNPKQFIVDSKINTLIVYIILLLGMLLFLFVLIY